MRHGILASLCIVGLLAAAPVLAARVGNFPLPEDCQVAGTALSAGSYSLSWTRLEGDQVEVKFFLRTKLAATVRGTLVENQPRVSRNEVLLRRGENGSMDLVEIRFAGTRERIQLPTS
jgi:hypothetical protein